MSLWFQTPKKGSVQAGKMGGGKGVENVTMRGQVTHEELSAGEHAHDPGAGPPLHASGGPVALTAARRPGRPPAGRGTAAAAAPSSGLLLQCQRRPTCPARRGAGALARDADSKQDLSLQRCTEP